MEFIKKYFIKQAIKKNDFSKVKSLNPEHKWKVLYDGTTEEYVNELVTNLQTFFNADKDSIVKFGVSEDVGSPSSLSYDSFNWLGDLDDGAVDKLLLLPCEYLIIYTENAGLLIRYLASSIKSNLQIGLPDDEPENDLTIDVNAKETTIFVEELKNYLAKIKFKHEAV